MSLLQLLLRAQRTADVWVHLVLQQQARSLGERWLLGSQRRRGSGVKTVPFAKPLSPLAGEGWLARCLGPYNSARLQRAWDRPNAGGAAQMEVQLALGRAGQVFLPPLLAEARGAERRAAAVAFPNPSTGWGLVPRPQTPVPAACFSCPSVPGRARGSFSHLGSVAARSPGTRWHGWLVGQASGRAFWR